MSLDPAQIRTLLRANEAQAKRIVALSADLRRVLAENGELRAALKVEREEAA